MQSLCIYAQAVHERTQSSGARLIVRLTSLAMESRFEWQKWVSEDEFDMSSAGFIVTDKKIKSDHAMAEVSQDAASSAASATPNQNRKYDHVTAEVTMDKVLRPIASQDSSSGSDSSAASATLNQKRKYDYATAEVSPDEVLEPVASQDCSSGCDAHLSSRWLEEMRPLLSPYDAKLLERYIPVLPPESLQKVKTEFQSDHDAYLARTRQRTQERPAEKIISKMSMRRILGTTFARLGLTDCLFQEMHKQWQATTTRSNRTGQQRAKHHTQQWHQRRGHHGRGYSLFSEAAQ